MPIAARKIALTDRSMQAMKAAPAGTRATVWDALMPGMAVRITDKGKRSFYAVRRRAGDPRPVWHLLGAYPVMTLAEAREAARAALTALMKGKHPKTLAEAKRRADAEAERAAAGNTFGAIAERFIAEYLPTIRSTKVYTARIRREMIPALGDRPIADIRRRDVIKLLEEISARSGPNAALGALAVLRKLLNWALARDIIESNPTTAIKPAELLGKQKARDRLLGDAEIAAIWHAAAAVGEPFATAYRVLLLTGARREEIVEAQWSDFDADAGTLLVPPERSKTGDAMLIPLPPHAVELIAALPRFAGPYIFTTTAGRVPIQALSQAKTRLDATLAQAGVEMPPFVVHDFRRAVRSNLGRLGVSQVVAELCLGHRQPGIVGVYDRHSYLDEKREALRRWEARLLSLVEPEPEPEAGGKVVPLLRRAAV